MADVIVIGGGIIGLTAAVRLQSAGLAVEVWSPGGPDRTVSVISAAVWYPSYTAFSPRVRDWALETYDEFTRQAASGVPGLALRPTRNVAMPTGDLWWAPPGLSVRSPDEATFVAPLAEMAVYLPWLEAQVPVVRRSIGALEEALAVAPLVVNASGLAARTLAGDDQVFPARGQIVLVRNPGLTESVRTPGAYVHPRTADVVLGGTFEPDNWDLTPDPSVTSSIVARTAALVPAVAGLPVIGERVGLRPCRHGGPRVSREGQIIHAYGHGGAGMTLSWGCAAEVVRLALS
ncbi:FAD-dependent oxidoreductase [Actinoplanes sp. NBRC 103695]|uniref:FAD-dependent oxidoreductase n=1 Tax=Actinoplanes sp. NBRC 103695 TaxID=3032202 RepID=UPI0024A12232|nr:FAD-dependent oxidoreductase [Actinoplanes sp. NBRC 103695]GLY95081.1 D-amino-acid oxidase [Actinoplanes sp. NBRC 103695]